jgi:hypothetical protein
MTREYPSQSGRIFLSVSDTITAMNKIRDPFLVVVLLVSLALGVSTLTRGHEWGDDWASYVMQAQSILNGNMDEFIERNSFTIFESSVQIGPVAYPWGYPLTLAPVLLLRGVHPLTLKLPGLFFFAGFLVCFYLLTETRLSRAERLLLLSLFAFSPVLIKSTDYVISDIPFLFSVFLTLWLMENAEVRAGKWSQVLVGAGIFLSFFFRTTGFVLLASYLAWQGWRFLSDRTRRKEILTGAAVVSGVFVLLWLISSLIFPGGQGSYFRQLAGLTFDTLQSNLINYFYLFVQFFDPNAAAGWTYLYYFLFAFFLAGVWMRRHADRLLIIFFIFYFAVMILWPEWQGIRFIFPLIPLLIYFAFQGMLGAVAKLPGRYFPIGRTLHALFWVALTGIFLFTSANHAYANLVNNRRINGPFESFSMEMYEYVRENTPADSVMVFFKPRALRLFTNRDAIMSIECDRLLLGDYVILHKNWEYSQILPGDIQNCRLPLKLVYENRKYLVYELQK